MVVTERKLTRYGYVLTARRARRQRRIWAWVLALLSLATGIAAITLVFG